MDLSQVVALDRSAIGAIVQNDEGGLEILHLPRVLLKTEPFDLPRQGLDVTRNSWKHAQQAASRISHHGGKHAPVHPCFTTQILQHDNGTAPFGGCLSLLSLRYVGMDDKFTSS